MNFNVHESFETAPFVVNLYRYREPLTSEIFAQITFENLITDLADYNIRLDFERDNLVMILEKRKLAVGYDKNNGTDSELLSSGFLMRDLHHIILGEKISLDQANIGYDIISANQDYIINISEVKSRLGKSIELNDDDMTELVMKAFSSQFCDDKKVEKGLIYVGRRRIDTFSSELKENVREFIGNQILNDGFKSVHERVLDQIINEEKYKINLFNIHNGNIRENIFDGFFEKYVSDKCGVCKDRENCYIIEGIQDKGITINFYQLKVSDFNWDEYFDTLIGLVKSYD